mgnify:CR=1 FL=1
MYINNKKRKLDSRDLETVQDADYFTCVYYRPRGQSKRIQFKSYKKAYQFGCRFTRATTNEIWYKRKIMFYAVKGTSQTFIGGLK